MKMSIADTDNFIASLGFEAYRVGGSVRDELIGREPHDADYMIRGVDLTDLYQALVNSAEGTSVRHAKVTDLILRDGQHVGYRVGRPYNIEITLPRREESTGPGHGDFNIVVDPTISLEEDAQRRDFTFNALYLPLGRDPEGDVDVEDPTGSGLHDLQRRIINVTHPHSFRDDPLRILRALRFVARGYDLGAETHALMMVDAKCVTGLTYKHEATSHVEKMDGGYTITRKRIPGDNKQELEVMSGTVYQEMCNILEGTHAIDALRIARDTGVLGTLFPELAPMLGFDQNSKYHDLTTDEHTFKALDNAVKADASLRVRWALLFHDSGKPEAAWTDEDGRMHFYGKVMQTAPDGVVEVETEDHEIIGARLWLSAAARMNIDKSMRDDVAKLIRNHMVKYKQKGVYVRVRRMRVQFGDSLLRDLLMHRLCDLLGKEKSHDVKFIDQIDSMETARRLSEEAGVPTNLKELEIDGRDLIEMGITGKKIGVVLRQVLDEVVVRGDDMAMTREWQLQRADGLRDYWPVPKAKK